jgi:serine/threonine protein kinase
MASSTVSTPQLGGNYKNNGVLNFVGAENVVSASPSPETLALVPPLLARHVSNASSIGTTMSRLSCSPQQATPRGLRVNPFQIISKEYMQILRKNNMAHCDKNQVLYRVDTMAADSVVSLTKSLIEMVEAFMEAYDEATTALAQQKHATTNHFHQHGNKIVAGSSHDNADSAHNSGSGVVGISKNGNEFGRPFSEDYDEPLSRISSALPHHLGNWRHHQHQLLSVDQPGLASFASVMTTASLRSMDERQPIAETHLLRKSQDHDGNKVINRYSVLADLGKGAFGKVKLGVNNETNETVAIKIIKKAILKRSSDPLALNREIAILKKVRHQNVVSLYEVIDDPESEKLYLVMQYVCNGPIVRVKSDFTCPPVPESTCKNYVRQLLSGVRYLHKRHIVHHDIKPDNILLGADGIVYITDFGVSEVFSPEQSLNESTRRGVGTPIFSAPELLAAKLAEGFGPPDITASMESDTDSQAALRKPRERTGSGTFDGVASDTWALGVTIFILLVGRAPFVGRNYTEVAEAVQNFPFEWTGVNAQGVSLNPLWKEVLQGMLEKDPKQRWTLKRVKNHAVFHDAEVEEPKVIGAMKKQASRAVIVTKAEVSHATTKISGFLSDDSAAPFSRAASTVAKNYVSKLRQRVVIPSNGASATASVVNASLSPSQERGDLSATNSGSAFSTKPTDFAFGDDDVGAPAALSKRTTMPFAASPPKDPAGSTNPRRVSIGSPSAHSPLTAMTSPQYPEMESDPPQNFDDVFSIRRPTVIGGPHTQRRRSTTFSDNPSESGLQVKGTAEPSTEC